MPDNELLELEIPQFEKVKSGKVREVFDMGESYLFVASDRVSAFDVVLPNGIPRKGEVLTHRPSEGEASITGWRARYAWRVRFGWRVTFGWRATFRRGVS